MSTHPEIAGWHIRADHHSAFVRTFQASPDATIDIDYETSERRKGRWIDATYTARVVGVYIAHRWDEKKGEWWSSASVRTRLINPATDEPYRSGWRDGVINLSSDDEASAPISGPLVDVTKPGTRITVIEEPA